MIDSCINFQDKKIAKRNKTLFKKLPDGKELHANFLLKCHQQKLIKSEKELEKFKRQQIQIETNYKNYESQKKAHKKKYPYKRFKTRKNIKKPLNRIQKQSKLLKLRKPINNSFKEIKKICKRNSIFCKMTNNTKRLLLSKKKKRSISAKELKSLKKYGLLKRGIDICKKHVCTPGFVSLYDIPRDTKSLLKRSLGIGMGIPMKLPDLELDSGFKKPNISIKKIKKQPEPYKGIYKKRTMLKIEEEIENINQLIENDNLKMANKKSMNLRKEITRELSTLYNIQPNSKDHKKTYEPALLRFENYEIQLKTIIGDIATKLDNKPIIDSCNSIPPKMINKIEPLKKISSGKFGTVKFGRLVTGKEKNDDEDCFVVLKILTNNEDMPVHQNEIKVLKYINSKRGNQKKYIADFFGTLQISGIPAIILKYYNYDTLQKKINDKLVNNNSLRIVISLCEGLNFLHSNNIVHLDLHSGNILLDINEDNNIVPYITDFGLSKIKGQRRPNKYNPRLMPPSFYTKRILNTTIDIWSFSLLLFEIIHKKNPLMFIRTIPAIQTFLKKYNEDVSQLYEDILTKNNIIHNENSLLSIDPRIIQIMKNHLTSYRYKSIKEILSILKNNNNLDNNTYITLLPKNVVAPFCKKIPKLSVQGKNNKIKVDKLLEKLDEGKNVEKQNIKNIEEEQKKIIQEQNAIESQNNTGRELVRQNQLRAFQNKNTAYQNKVKRQLQNIKRIITTQKINIDTLIQVFSTPSGIEAATRATRTSLKKSENDILEDKIKYYKDRIIGYNESILKVIDKVNKINFSYLNKENSEIKKQILKDIDLYLQQQTCIEPMYNSFKEHLQNKIVENKINNNEKDTLETLINDTKVNINESFRDIKTRRDSGLGESNVNTLPTTVSINNENVFN